MVNAVVMWHALQPPYWKLEALQADSSSMRITQRTHCVLDIPSDEVSHSLTIFGLQNCQLVRALA